MSTHALSPRVLRGSPRLAVNAAFLLNGVLLGTWASRVPAVLERFQLTEASFGVLLLVMGIGALAAFPLAGSQADQRGAYPVTLFIASIYLLTLIAIGAAPGLLVLGIAMFLFGASHGAMDVTMNAWAAEVERASGRSIMTSFHAMWSLGAGLGAGGGWLAVRLDLGLGWHFLIAPVVVAALVGPFLITDWQSSRRARDRAAPVFALPKGPLILVGLIAMCAGLGEGAAADWSAVYLRDVIGTTESHAALAFAAFSLAMVAMRLLADGLITRLGPVTIARAGALIAAFGYVLALGPLTLPTALLGYVCMGIGYSALVPLAFSRAAADPVIPPGQAIASVATLGYGALLIGPPVIGFLAELASLRVSLACAGVLALLVAVLATNLRRP
jgi:MFS family permease